MDDYQPEVIHSFESAAHQAFLNSLYHCKRSAKGDNNTLFTQCIKAAGVNFKYSYDQFLEAKWLRQQSLNNGHRD